MKQLPEVRFVVTVDLTDDDLNSISAVEDAALHQLRGVHGAHVRLVLGDAATRWPSSARFLAGRLLDAASIEVEHRGRYPSTTRTFAQTLARELRAVAQDFADFTTG